MNKILTISTLTLLISFPALAQDQPQTPKQKSVPLIEGFKFDRIDGLLIKDDKQDNWFFTPENNLTDGRGLIPAGQKIRLLPSSTLEAMAAAAKKTPHGVSLSATVTKYRGQNFLFPTHFLLTSTPEQITAPEEEQQQKQKDEEEDNLLQDSIIPADVLKKLKPKNQPAIKSKQIIQSDKDSILSGRTGFVTLNMQNKTFNFDALGRNVENINLQLLPCQTLEKLENKIAKSPYRQRYRIVGITTKYKNNYYLLPQQAVRTYNHGNFAR